MQKIAYPDGGYGLGGYTGGGGSSCVCWDAGELASRIIVAGGGGGVCSSITDDYKQTYTQGLPENKGF